MSELETTCGACEKKFDFGYNDMENLTSGSGHNYEFGQTEYWFSGDIKCPACGTMNCYGDSSL